MTRIAALQNGTNPDAGKDGKDMTRNLTAVDPATFTDDSSPAD